VAQQRHRAAGGEETCPHRAQRARGPPEELTFHRDDAEARIPVYRAGVGACRLAEFYQVIGRRTVRVRKEMPGHVANRLQAALAREVYYLVAEGVVSAADVDTALCWGPGLRWGLMGNLLLNHLGGGAGGIEHFLEQFTRPLTAWWKTLGNPVLTPEVQKKLIDSVHAEVGSRSIDSLAMERDEMLLGLLELRTRTEKAFQMDGKDAKAG
jgi:hypothetical protein